MSSRHGEHCRRSGKWFVEKACRDFSTDGTALGAEIAHTMGTTSEDEIIRQPWDYERDIPLGQMDAEQADWEEGR